MGLGYRGGVDVVLLCWPGGNTPPSGEVMGRLCRGRYHLSTCDVEIDTPLPPPLKKRVPLQKIFGIVTK
jgi:hypothetical protein